jgi:hypothetical protein
MKLNMTAIVGAARGRGRWLTSLMMVCALALTLAPAAQAQSPFPQLGAPGSGTMLLVPSALIGPIFALNPQLNINVINNFQIGDSNFALIQVQQGNLIVPASGVPALLQFNVNVINNVQIGSNNVAIISVGQGNAG